MYAGTMTGCIIDPDSRNVQQIFPQNIDSERLLSRIYLHQGRTDESGGHYDWLNRMGLGIGSYHYHHGLLAHLHPSGVCPYGENKVSIINPYTNKKIVLGTPYYYEGNSYFSLNLVSKALTARDSTGVKLAINNTEGTFNICSTGDSSIIKLGEEFTFAYPRGLFSPRDNTLFETDNGKLSLLCHTKKADLDDTKCYAYISLEAVREYMLKDGYFTDFFDNGTGVWSFIVRRPSVNITFPDGSISMFKVGDSLTVKANISNADSAKLTIGQHTEVTNTLINQREVTFRTYTLAEEDAGNLTLKVEVTTGGTAAGAATVISSVLLQVDSLNELMMKNLEKDTTLGLSDEMKKTMVGIGRIMLNEGYKPAFVAGMLANIEYEGGTAGLFEDSTYNANPSDEPPYIQYMDDNYNYRMEYAAENIKDKKLSTVYAILNELEKKDWIGGFGIGCVQWSFDRAKTLLELYMEVAGDSDTITFEQILKAESLMILKELKESQDDKGESIYAHWKPIDYDSMEAAYDAGVIVCKEYERPYEDTSKARGEIAKAFYTVMLDNNL